MEESYSIADARDRLPSLVHEAEEGRPVRITRRGKPVAVLVSEREYERLTGAREDFWDSLNKFRASLAPGTLAGLKESLDDARDPSPGRDVVL